MKGYLDALEDLLRGVEASAGTTRPFRLTVTGSRDGWEPMPPPPLVECFRTVYAWYGQNVRLGHGAARGIDMAADRLGRRAHWLIMPYPVSRREWDVYGGYAGHQRNARMLETEAPDLVLALIWHQSKGSTGCADNATARGMAVLRIDEELSAIPRSARL